MRNATILVITLKGLATETIKNIVLAGVGKLVVADPEEVSPEDLGAGFFFRDEDVGTKVRVIASELILRIDHSDRGLTQPSPTYKA
jgi:ubiquitin-like 1-activating enzyme E1 A